MSRVDTSSVQTQHIAAAAGVSAVLALQSYFRKSLTETGSLAAFVVGYTTASSGAIPFAALASFYLSSTYITKLGKERKAAIEVGYNPKGHRSAYQVFCNGGIVAVMVAARWLSGIRGGPTIERPRIEPLMQIDGKPLLMAILAHYAACQGDTWSSELGVLARSLPRMITAPWRAVPAGTNGGMTAFGTGAAVAGSLVVGVACCAAQAVFPVRGVDAAEIVGTCLAAGLAGTVVDSLLGATLQYSGRLPDGRITNHPTTGAVHISGVDVLSNSAVNLISAAIVTAGAFFYWRGRH
jgi:uncharacterized membrane protein